MKMDKFVSFMESCKTANEKSDGNSKYYSQLTRDFRKAYTNNNTSHLIHLEKAGVSLYEGDMYEIRKLIGYMYSKDIISMSGISLGNAFKKIDRNEKFLQKFIDLDFNRLIINIKNLTGLFASKDIKLNPDKLFQLLACWNSQKTHENKNWVKKMIIKDFFWKEESNEANSDSNT